MNILILGGTIFLGRHLVEAALARGHHVTLFHRGRHNPGLFPGVETILGDRTIAADLKKLTANDRRFDAVIDTCGYVPRVVRMSAEQLAARVGIYCFISSVSVFRDFTQPGIDDSAPGKQRSRRLQRHRSRRPADDGRAPRRLHSRQ